MATTHFKYQSLFYLFAIILILPALLINLGLFPLSADEATRAIVALEMELSGNIVAPTINGDFYFNKPPLYNWILLLLFKITGNHSDFIIRLPAVVSLLLFSYTIFYFLKKHYPTKLAFISAMAFFTCGRILFYESSMGLIDLSFTWLLFLNIMLIYHWLSREKYYGLFIISYLIAAITFLMKGLPALVFQGFSLLAAFIFFRKFKKLFSLAHLSGFLIFLIMAGSYYLALWQQNPSTEYFSTLVSESTKRTFIEYGWGKTLIHFFTFPPKQLYQLLPWSVFFIFFLKKSFYQWLRKNRFLSFLTIIFLVNIPVYWISVETYPRYLLMLYPIPLILAIAYYFESAPKDLHKRIAENIILWTAVLLIPVGLWFYLKYPFHTERFLDLSFISLMIVLILFIIGFIKVPKFRLEFFIIFLLILRIAFNMVVIPDRKLESRLSMQKEQALKVGELTTGKDLWLVKNTGISVESIYYITKERGEIFQKHPLKYEQGAFYIINDMSKLRDNEIPVYRFESRWNNSKLRLSTFSKDQD